MPSVEELLNQDSEEVEAYADIGIEYCTVDDDTRLVTIPDKYKKFGVESDEKAKRIWFRFPKLVGNNGVDLSAIGVRVNFRNANGDGDIYIVEDLTADGDYVTFSWELTRKVTAYKGHVSFVVCAVKSSTDGTTKNEWNTTLNKECEVLEGLEVTEQIAEENPDIIEYILANLGGSVSAEQIATAVEEYMAKNPQKDVSYEPQELTEEQKAQARKNIDAEASGTAESKVSEHNVATDAHNDIRLLIDGLTTRLNALADSDDTTLDQMSEVVAYIKSNKSLIDAITTSKINVSDIIDNLTTNVSNKPLSAAQGVALKALIDAIVVPSKISDLQNDSNFISSPATAEVGQVLEVEAVDEVGKPTSWKVVNMPESLPNPHALTFTGAVTDTYNGSEAKTIEIPNVSGGGSGITFKGELIATLQGDNVSSEITQDISSEILTDGMYYAQMQYGSNLESNYSDIAEGVTVNEQMYFKVGGAGIWGKGTRFLYNSGNANITYGSAFFVISNGIIFISHSEASSNNGIDLPISTLEDYRISIYSQNSKVLTSDTVTKLYKLF